MYDVVIIGGGISGCSLAYYLSRYTCNVLLLEKENDLAIGTTRANSAILHAGYDPHPGTLMAETNVWGNKIIFELVKDLDVEYKQCGSMVLAFTEAEIEQLHELLRRGEKNGVPNQKIIYPETIRKMEPEISDEVLAALYAPTAGVINPWELALAMAEVAVKNGVKIKLDSEVKDIISNENGYTIRTSETDFQAKYIVNCAGVNAERIHSLVTKPTFKIVPTKGEYYLLDHTSPIKINHILFQCPNEKGKGVLVSTTMHENVIVGPNATVVEDPEDTSNTRDGLKFVAKLAKKTVPKLDLSYNIRNFAGIRANCDRKDFVLEWASKNFLDMAGIQSPGLTSAPALAVKAVEMLVEAGLGLTSKENWNGKRKVIRFKHLTPEDRTKIIAKDGAYGRVICRCETITEGEIRDALNSLLPARTLDGVKRRCGSGLGRCQGGFCGPKIIELIANKYKCKPEEICLDKNGTFILLSNENQEEK